MESLIEGKNITKRFVNHTALKNVSFRVPEQSIYGLLGPNGAGKTTLIRIINQILFHDEGTIYFAGEKLDSRHIAMIGYLPEERGLYKKMKVGEQALYLAQLKGLSKKEATIRLKDWFRKFEIESWWNRKVIELSKGMQQKVQFITTVLHEPKLLIFDEPFSGFDPINVNMLKDEIIALKKKGSTIIFSTHNMASVEELCDYITLINNAEIVLEGKVNEIKQQYKANTYFLEYERFEGELRDILPSSYQILDENRMEQTARIRILDNNDSNQLIQELLPRLSIKSFHEILPSMNDIFINKVQN